MSHILTIEKLVTLPSNFVNEQEYEVAFHNPRWTAKEAYQAGFKDALEIIAARAKLLEPTANYVAIKEMECLLEPFQELINKL